MSLRNAKLKSQISHLAAEFLRQEATPQSLITVTDLELSADGKYGTIFLSVLPDEQSRAALGFARRQRAHLRHFIFGHLRVGRLPKLDFALDLGEKNRQRIDELVNEAKPKN